jgi:hypothetical protein
LTGSTIGGLTRAAGDQIFAGSHAQNGPVEGQAVLGEVPDQISQGLVVAQTGAVERVDHRGVIAKRVAENTDGLFE